MSRGLGKIQFKILVMLQTKQDRHDPNMVFFSTDEVISEFNLDYRLWLRSTNQFGETARSRNRLRKYESQRVSHHRALQGLEKRGLIVSYFHRNSRYWGVPERIKDLDTGITRQVQLNWVEYDKERKEDRRETWKYGWRRRRIRKEEKAKIKELYDAQTYDQLKK